MPQWLRAFSTWLRSLTAVQEKPPKTLETYTSEDGKRLLCLIYDQASNAFPGVVSCWHIAPKPESLEKLIQSQLNKVGQTWINLAKACQITPKQMELIAKGKEQPTVKQVEAIATLTGIPSQRLHNAISPANDLIIVLVNIEGLGHLSASGIDSDKVIFQRIFETKAKHELEKQRHIKGSHIFLTGWVSKRPIKQRFVDGKIEHYKHLDAGDCYVVDLQGSDYGFVGANFQAERIVRAIAYRALNTEPGLLNSWEDLFRRMNDLSLEHNWLSWLNFYATRNPQTRLPDRDHVLQPKRMIGRKKGRLS